MSNVQVLRHANDSSQLMGYVETTYDALVQTFGEPANDGDGYKTRAEWILRTPAGVAKVYDYKDDADVRDVTDWHVGGTDPDVVNHVQDALDSVLDVRK